MKSRAKRVSSIRTVGFVSKKFAKEAKHLEQRGKVLLEALGIKVLCESEKLNKEDLIKESDLVVVLGGDGTFISMARHMVDRSVPILGVHLGQLGFLTEVKKEEFIDALQLAVQGGLPVSERTMLKCDLVRNGKILLSSPVVNDAVISRGEIARIFDMSVSVDDTLVAKMKADGIIAATPTGSTAYCLAAGGPLLSPTLPAIEIVPICPHSLTLRPLVVSDSSTIEILPTFKSGTVILTLDGQTSVPLKSEDRLIVSRFRKHRLKILHIPSRNYFSLLREKLKFGYRD